MNILKVRQPLATISVAAVLAGAGLAQADDLVTVRYHEYPGSNLHLSNWVAEKQGFCADHGLRCEAVYLASGPLAQQTLMAGGVDVIVSSMEVMLQAVAAGMDLQVIGNLTPSGIYGLAVTNDVAAQEKPYEHIRVVGVSARGSGTEMHARSLLADAGLDPDSLTYIAVGAPAAAFAALYSNQVDAVLSWDPVLSICEVSQTCTVLVDQRKGEGPNEVKRMAGAGVVWQARASSIAADPETYAAFMAAQADAVEWIRDPANEAELLALATEHIDLGIELDGTEQLLAAMVDDMKARLDVAFDPKAVEGYSDFMMRWGLISSPITAEQVTAQITPLAD